MTDTLFIQLASASSAGTTPVDWVLFSVEQSKQGRKITGGNCSLADVMVQTKDYPDKLIVALVPGTEVVQTHITVPAGQQRHLQQTLPFLVEEEIASPIEDMHLCLGSITQQQATVSAVSHQAMLHWQQQLKAAHIDADWLLPDSAALALSNHVEVLVDAEYACFNCAGQAVMISELDNLSFIADTLLEHLATEKTPAANTNTNSGKLWLSQQLPAAGQAAAAALSTQFEVAGIALHQETISGRFEFFCARLLPHLNSGQSTPLINLLSGEYRSTSKRQTDGKPKWRLLALVVTACIIIKLLLDVGSGLYLNRQGDQLDEQIKTLYHDLFPQDRRIVNVKVQMQNHLKGQMSASGSSFMPLFSYMAGAISELDDASNLKLQQLRYNDKTQTLLVDIDVKNVQQLEKIKQLIEARNVKVSILSANKERQWIKGRVRLAL